MPFHLNKLLGKNKKFTQKNFRKKLTNLQK